VGSLQGCRRNDEEADDHEQYHDGDHSKVDACKITVTPHDEGVTPRVSGRIKDKHERIKDKSLNIGLCHTKTQDRITG